MDATNKPINIKKYMKNLKMLFNLLLILDLRTYVPFTPLQLFWQPTPFCPLRIVLVASRRVALSVRYVLNTWRVVQGLVRRLRPHSHCKTSRADWASKTKVHYEMEAFTLHAEPSQTEPDRTGPNRTEPDRACPLAQVHKSLEPIRPGEQIIYTLLYTLAPNVFSTITAPFPSHTKLCISSFTRAESDT